MLVNACGNIDQLSRRALLVNKDTLNEVKCRCLIACGSIHRGHEQFILVMNLEEGKRFLCV